MLFYLDFYPKHINVMKNRRPILLTLLVCIITLLCSCSGGVSLTTPKQDGEKCEKLLRDCNTLKDVDAALETIIKYYEAYEKAVYNGKITGPQYEVFLKTAPNADEVETIKAYIIENGHGPNKR